MVEFQVLYSSLGQSIPVQPHTRGFFMSYKSGRKNLLALNLSNEMYYVPVVSLVTLVVLKPIFDMQKEWLYNLPKDLYVSLTL